MSHAYCIDCGKITSCGDGGCDFCKDKMAASDIASKHGHWERCNECFAKLPPGTKSEYIIGYEKDLAEVKDELISIEAQLRELKKRQDFLNRRKTLIEEDLVKYGGDST